MWIVIRDSGIDLLKAALVTPRVPRQSQQTRNICITFTQRRPNVYDVGPTLYKCYTNVLCLLDNTSSDVTFLT